MYDYVGLKEIKDSVVNYPIGTRIKSQQDIKNWVNRGKYAIARSGFIFRRCTKCSLLNVVKDNLFICAECHEQLPTIWNCKSTK